MSSILKIKTISDILNFNQYKVTKSEYLFQNNDASFLWIGTSSDVYETIFVLIKFQVKELEPLHQLPTLINTKIVSLLKSI